MKNKKKNLADGAAGQPTKRTNSTVGFRPSADVQAFIDSVLKLRPEAEKSDVVNTAVSLAAQHATPAELLTLLDKRALESEAVRLEAQLAEVRAALANQSAAAPAA